MTMKKCTSQSMRPKKDNKDQRACTGNAYGTVFIFHSAIMSSILIPSSALLCLFLHTHTHSHTPPLSCFCRCNSSKASSVELESSKSLGLSKRHSYQKTRGHAGEGGGGISRRWRRGRVQGSQQGFGWSMK